MSRIGAAPVTLSHDDLIWLAGYLEGEGSFQFKKHGSVAVIVASNDKDVIEHVAKTLDSTITLNTHNGQWATGVYGRKGAHLMMQLFPLMGIRRKEQIRDSLTKYLAHRERRSQ